MKILEDKYPMGTLQGQRTAGRYMDGTLHENIKILAEKITNDMQFFGLICSSTYEVRTGKSTLLQQIGEDYTDMVNKIHGLNLTFDMKNIVFNSKDLMTRATELPKYSFLALDENDEIDEHYFSQLAKDLRRFFRKSGQLNLFILMIVPNFFQLKSNYAISRSNFLIDVKFFGKFERGYFSFYNFGKKRTLFVKGKKEQNYLVVHPDFSGRFLNGYAVDKEEYLKAKRKDFVESDKDKQLTEKEIKVNLFKQLHTNLPELSVKKLSEAFGFSDRTGFEWLKEVRERDLLEKDV
jgi:hypothetical protein